MPRLMTAFALTAGLIALQPGARAQEPAPETLDLPALSENFSCAIVNDVLVVNVQEAGIDKRRNSDESFGAIQVPESCRDQLAQELGLAADKPGTVKYVVFDLNDPENANTGMPVFPLNSGSGVNVLPITPGIVLLNDMNSRQARQIIEAGGFAVHVRP